MYIKSFTSPLTISLLAFSLAFGAPGIFIRSVESLQVSRAPRFVATPFFFFPEKYQPENIIPRSTGQLLVTVNTVPELWQIDPYRNQTGELVHRFDGFTSLFGIVQSSVGDIYYLVASNFTGGPNFYGFEGSVSVFEVDLRGSPAIPVNQSAVKISKVVDVPKAQLLDGFASANRSAGLYLSGDAQTGVIYSINTLKRTATAVLQDALLNGTSTSASSGLAHVGINGIKVNDNYLYFTNTARGIYGKLPINRTSGLPAGNPSIIENYKTNLDDLSFDTTGNQYISVPLTGIYFRTPGSASVKSRTTLLVELYGANANTLGATPYDKDILYSTFNGAPSGIARINLTSNRRSEDE